MSLALIAENNSFVSKSTTHSLDSLARCSSLTQIKHRATLLFVAMPRFSPHLFLALFTEKPIFPAPFQGIHRPRDLQHRARMFFSRPNELHPSGRGKTGRVIAKHVPVRSISISLIYFSKPTRYTRSSVGVVGEPPPEDRSLRASASNNVLSSTRNSTGTREHDSVYRNESREEG